MTSRVQGLNEYASYIYLAKNFLLSIWVMVYLLELLINVETINVFSTPFFLISLGLLISSLGSFFIDGLMNSMILMSNEMALSFYHISVSLTYLFYVTIAISFVRAIKLMNVKIDAGK